MKNIQSEFIRFHNNIMLSDENAELREKRDILLDKLKKNISDEAASYTTFNQGSYALGTGIKPTDGDYDIDVGLRFEISKDDYSDPTEIKKWVKNALDGHTKSVKIRRSCVTVTYQKNNEPIYHVDFACYSAENADDKLYIAKGKENSDEEHKYWEISDPQGLINTINDKYSDTNERAQFKRIIRYMKKWKNEHFSTSGSAAPTGIALTVLAYNLFSPEYTYDPVTEVNKFSDFNALQNLVASIKNEFRYTYNIEDQKFYHTISVKLPVEPHNNLFEKMTEKQQEDMYDKLCTMEAKLKEAELKEKKAETCRIMAQIFGSDFPIPTEHSYVGTSESALL
ncbi:MAG: nucleotidyltransferase [Oscillospiraceae bacterium]